MIEKTTSQKVLKKTSLSLSPIQLSLSPIQNSSNAEAYGLKPSPLQPKSQNKLKSQHQQQQQQQQQLQAVASEQLQREQAKDLKQQQIIKSIYLIKTQIFLSFIFLCFIVSEIVIVSKRKWFNPHEIPHCEFQMKWTIGSILGKFLFSLASFLAWKGLKKNKEQSYSLPFKSKQLIFFERLTLLLCLGCFIGQFVYINESCGALQISLIILGTVILLLSSFFLIIFILKKII